LPGHETVLVEDHLHALFPKLPGIGRDLLVDPLPKLSWPRWIIEPGKFFLELDAEDLTAAFVSSRPLRDRRITLSHGAQCTASPAVQSIRNSGSTLNRRGVCGVRRECSTARDDSPCAKMNPR